MAVLDSTAVSRDAKSDALDPSPLARVMREFEELVQGFETGLLRSLEDPATDDVSTPKSTARRDEIRREACRLAISDLSNQYTPKYIRRSLDAAELEGKRVEDQLQSLSLSGRAADDESDLGSLHNGYFRLYSTELFDLLVERYPSSGLAAEALYWAANVHYLIAGDEAVLTAKRAELVERYPDSFAAKRVKPLLEG